MLKQDLVEIVERASTVEERLGGDFSPTGGNEAVVDKRLEAWCQALGKGDWDRLERRLAWDGLDLETVRPALSPVRLRDGAALPEWSLLLAEALRLAPPERREDEAWPAQMGFLDAEDPLPFEEVLAPFVLVARERLAGHTASFEESPSEAARASLERSLLRSLSSASGGLLLGEFEAMRAREQSSWDRMFALAQDPEGRSLYRRFVRRLGEEGMARLLRRYPVLARQLGTISQLWVEANAEFFGRLEADMPELERLFGDGNLGDVVELEPSLSDPHGGRRSVVALTFASGQKLVYKPKDMGTEAAYHRLLAWLNERGAPLPFKVLRVLDRPTHGWVEFVEHLPCRDQDEARRYYERAGMLLCLFYLLEGTDCHYENIIASGEYPVLIDTETLMHHRAEQATQARAEMGRFPRLSRPERPVHFRQTRSAACVSRLRRRGHERHALACSASASLATARRTLAEHVRTIAPPLQDRVPAWRAARSQGIPGRQPPLAYANRRKVTSRLVVRRAAVSLGEKACPSPYIVD